MVARPAVSGWVPPAGSPWAPLRPLYLASSRDGPAAGPHPETAFRPGHSGRPAEKQEGRAE